MLIHLPREEVYGIVPRTKNGPVLAGSGALTMADPRLCAVIVDRLTFNGSIIETGTDSYRLAHTIAQRAS